MAAATSNRQLQTPRALHWTLLIGVCKLGFGSWALALLLAAVIATPACSAGPEGPPAIEIDRTVCSHCGMLISEPLYAAAYQAPDRTPRVFDDIGCLLAAARAEEGRLTFWFHDADDGGWIAGEPGGFVSSPEIRSPMGGGVLAYRQRSDAERAAMRHRGRLIASTAALIAKDGEQ